MLANTDALGAYSIHYRDAATGYPISIRKHPNVTTINWAGASRAATQNSKKGAAYKADLLPNCVNNSVVKKCTKSWYSTGNPNRWDNAHQPAESYVPYMVTGDYYYMSELAFGASHNEIWSNEAYRGYSKGLIDGSHGQVRGKAWVLREMANAAWLLPDSHPLKAEFKADVENSLADWNAKYTNNPNANPLSVTNDSVIYSVNDGKRNGVAPWQHNFLTWSAGHSAELGFAGAAEFRNWLAKFEISLMTDWLQDPTRGFCWLQAAAYKIQVKDASGNWLPSFSAVYAATWPQLVGLACNSPAMLDVIGRKAGEMSGYPYSSTGFPANFQIGLAAAADSGLANAQTAWSVFDSRSVKPSGSKSYNNDPNFAILPRLVQASAVPPPTMPPPLDPLAASNPPPVPKEMPARRCFGSGCNGNAEPVVSSAAPHPVASSTPPVWSVGVATAPTGNRQGSSANNAVTVSKSAATMQAPTRPVRQLIRVVCRRLDAWCARLFPQAVYVPATEASSARSIISAAAASARQADVAPVAPAMTPRFTTTNAMQGQRPAMQRR